MSNTLRKNTKKQLITLLLVTLFTVTVFAQNTYFPSSDGSVFGSETAVCYGYSQRVPIINEQESAHFNALWVDWSVKPFWKQSSSENFPRHLVIETFASTSDKSRYLFAVVPMMRWNFPIAKHSTWLYTEIGTGVSFSDVGDPDVSSNFNFMTNLGFGIRHFINADSSLIMGWRYHHVSNAGTVPPNRGLNDQFIYVGYCQSVK